MDKYNRFAEEHQIINHYIPPSSVNTVVPVGSPNPAEVCAFTDMV